MIAPGGVVDRSLTFHSWRVSAARSRNAGFFSLIKSFRSPTVSVDVILTGNMFLGWSPKTKQLRLNLEIIENKSRWRGLHSHCELSKNSDGLKLAKNLGCYRGSYSLLLQDFVAPFFFVTSR